LVNVCLRPSFATLFLAPIEKGVRKSEEKHKAQIQTNLGSSALRPIHQLIPGLAGTVSKRQAPPVNPRHRQ